MSASGQNLAHSIMQGVLNKDYGVQLLAKGAGAFPVHELEALARNPDAEIRLLAVHCLRETGDPSAATGLVEAVFDPHMQVAMAAARALHTIAGPDVVARLLAAFDQSIYPAVRREAALVLGPIADSDELGAMKQRWNTEGSGEAKEGLTVALAGRGDDDARLEFNKRLLASKGDDRARWLENAELVAEPWLLSALGQILSDRTPLLRVGVDARPDLIQALRACDLALLLVAKITGARFSFPVTRDHNYTDVELQEARRVAGASSLPTP
jgi:HEAT repeat protein